MNSNILKVILGVFLLLVSLKAEDKFMGIEMLSKVDKNKWTCKEYWIKPFNSCTPKGTFTDVSSVMTDPKNRVVQIWYKGNFSAKPMSYEKYMNWVELTLEKLNLVGKYGKLDYRKTKYGGYIMTTKVNKTFIEVIIDSFPNVHFTHDLYYQLEK